jgi:hypothetical protein
VNVDLTNIIASLRAELERLNATIAALESLDGRVYSALPPLTRDRRGRKTMGQEERKQVSERIRRYWEQRKAREAETPDLG